MTKRLKAAVIVVLSALMLICLSVGAWIWVNTVRANAETAQAQSVSYDTVAVHDPSIVVAYEDAAGNTYPTAESAGGGSVTKVYYVFGTQAAQAKSYDLINWTSFENNLNSGANLMEIIGAEAEYSGLTEDTVLGNIWAPDVIYNTAMGKWCMYLSVNGEHQYSSIVMLTADNLDGAWSYGGGVVYSRITAANVGNTDYAKVTGSSTVDPKYSVYRNSSDNLLYGVNAIDPAVTYDENGDLWMTYGSWFGGIYLLKLDKYTGLRDYSYTYENDVRASDGSAFTGTISSGETFAVYSDEYLGIHLAGGHHAWAGGEGSYVLKIGDWWYLFLSYGGYDPEDGYNMRVFRSETLTGFDAEGNFVGYRDAAGNSPIFTSFNTVLGGEEMGAYNGSVGVRIMSGYTWSWWDYSYIAQGHNSAFVDDDGNAYLIYHNKYTDGTIFHVMKVHRLLVNTDGWLVTSPFESTVNSTGISEADELATDLKAEQIAGTYGTIYMTRNNGTYSEVCTESQAVFAADGTVSEGMTGSWTYNPKTGAFRIRISGGYAFNGYLLYQNLEGTNIRTLVFTIVSTEGSNVSQYTYWGYKYPTTSQQAEYFVNSMAIPNKIGDNAEIPTGTQSNGLWDDVKVTFSYTDGTLTALYPGGTITRQIATTGSIAEYEQLSAGQTFMPIDTTNGISISFDYSNYFSDWTHILSGNGFNVNLSTIEYGSTDIFESDAANSGQVGSVANHEIFYTSGTARASISFNTDGSICFFLNDVLALTYASSTVFNDDATTVGTVCAAILSEFASGTVSSAYAMENVVIDKALPSVAATEVLYEINGGYYTVDYEPAVNAENTNTGWWKGALGATSLPTGNNAVIYRYARTHDNTDNAIQMFKPDDSCGTFYPFGPLNNEWPNDWQTSGSVSYYLNGAVYTGSLNTGTTAGENGFWHGAFVITFLRYDDTLYLICDFTRTSDGDNLVAIYTFVNITEELTVQFSGYSADITGCTVAHSTSISYSATAPVTEHVHAYTETSRTGNACVGYTITYACSCGDSYTEKDFTGVVGHQYGKSNVAATCTEGAKSIYTCSVCRDSFTVITAPALGHNWSAWGVTTQPTLEGTGQLTRTCSRDGAHAETFTLPALSETNYTYSATAATCTAAGTGTYTYGKDGQSFQFTVTIPALGHDWGTPEYNGTVLSVSCERADCGSKVTANLTFSAGEGSGSVTKIAATFDGKDFLVTLPGRGMEAAAEGMLFVGWTYEENTYSLNEQVTLAGGGNYTFTARYELHNHTYTPVEGSAATCTEAGIKAHYTCTCGRLFTADGETYTEVMQEDLLIPATGHTEEKIPAVAATCTEAGSTAGVKCSVCDEILKKPVTIPATGHTEEETPAVAATCTTAGSTAGVECSVCGETLKEPETIAALGHSWDEGTVTTEPTCTETGIRTFTCVRGCGETKTESVPAASHSYGNWSVKTAPTAETAGVLVRVCEVCDGEETFDIPILNADDYTVTTINATCSAEGSATYTYAKDGQEIDVAVVSIPKTAHSWGEWRVTKQPTYTEAGQETRTCSVCNDTETRAVAALGLAQKFVDEVAAIAEATDRQSQFEAISAALTTYAQLSAEEKTEVASTYAVLETAIGAYNEAAEDVNGEMLSAMEIALITISSAAAAMGALAAVWLVVKKLI